MPRTTRSAITCICAAASLLAGGCREERAASSTPSAPPPVEVATGLAELASLPELLEVTGTLVADEESVISAKMGGRIVEIKADLGDTMPSGALLARIDATDYELELAQREAALRASLASLGLDAMPDASFDPEGVPTVRRADAQARNARERLDRARQLHTRTPPLISDQDFADIQTQFDVARNDFEVARLAAYATLAEARTRGTEIDLARQLVADTVVRVPSDQSGRTWSVARRSVSLGELVQPGTAMFTLVVDQPIRLRAAVPERASARVQIGQIVRLEVEGTSVSAEGVIRRISPAIDPTTRTLAVEAVFANADRSLRPGAFARGRIVVGEQTGLVQVPESAIFSFAGIRRVFVIDQDKVRARQVEIIRIDGDRAFVRGEVEPGAQVAITQLGKLSDGAAIRIAPVAPSPSATN